MDGGILLVTPGRGALFIDEDTFAVTKLNLPEGPLQKGMRALTALPRHRAAYSRVTRAVRNLVQLEPTLAAKFFRLAITRLPKDEERLPYRLAATIKSMVNHELKGTDRRDTLQKMKRAIRPLDRD